MSEEAILRANRARQILDDPLFIEAFEGLEKGAIERISACDTHDKERLQTLALSLQTIRAVRHRFQLWVADGEDAARRQIQREEAPSLINRLNNRFRRQA